MKNSSIPVVWGPLARLGGWWYLICFLLTLLCFKWPVLTLIFALLVWRAWELTVTWHLVEKVAVNQAA